MNGQQARRSNRLPNYDYAQNGAYFITACTLGRQNIFWEELPSAENVGAHIVRPRPRCIAALQTPPFPNDPATTKE